MSTAEMLEAEDMRTEGAKLFDAFMLGDNPTRLPIAARVAAVALNVTEPTISSWRLGKYSPDMGSRCVIEAWTGGKVPVETWETEAEKDRIKYANTLAPFGQDWANNVKSKKKNKHQASVSAIGAGRKKRKR